MTSDEAASATDSKQGLVDAAVQLILEHHQEGTDLKAAFGYLTPGSVAQRAGVSRALIYHYWGGEGDAMRELVAEVAGRVWQQSTDLGVVAGQLIELSAEVTGPLTTSDVARQLAWQEMQRVVSELRPALRAAMTMTVHGLVEPDLFDVIIDELAASLAALGERLGVEPASPLEWDDVALSLYSVFQGFCYGANVSERQLLAAHDWTPEVPCVTDGAEWNLFGVAIETILRKMVRPVTAELSGS